MIHGQVWLQLNVRWMARVARSLQGVRKRPNRRLEAVRPSSFRAGQKFLAAFFGTVVTGGILVALAANWSLLVPYSIGLFAGFSPAFILAYWRLSALVGGVLLVGVTGMLIYDAADDPGEQVWVPETMGEPETPAPEASAPEVSPQPAPPPLPPPPSVEKSEAVPQREAGPQGKEAPKDITLQGIPFAFNDQTIRPEYLPALNETARILNATPTLSVLIEGYADAVGSEAFNLRLSRVRAEAVRDYLVECGIAADRLRVVGRGEVEPLAPNGRDDGSDNPDGRAANRRVELSVE